MVDVCSSKCRTEGCGKRPSLGVARTKTAEYCAHHAPEGMVNVYNKKCGTEGSGKRPSLGAVGTKTAEYCAHHAPEGMINVDNKKCRTESCVRLPSFGVAGMKRAEYCKQHAPGGMVCVKSNRCKNESCGKFPTFGVAGTKTAAYCKEHAPEGMVDVKRKRCKHESCGKVPTFVVAGKKTKEYCAKHALDGMVSIKSGKCRTNVYGKRSLFAQHAPDVYIRKYRTGGCGQKPSFEVADSKTAEHCAQHARIQRGVEGCREREFGPHHSGKETIGNVIPSGAKGTTTVYPSPNKKSHPSGVSRDSRKRVRHPEITSTASKRADAQQSTAGAVTMPDIDRQKSPVRRSSGVKMEVQLSL